MKPSFRERMQYWFDSRIMKGQRNLILLLFGGSLLLVTLIILLMTVLTGDFGNFMQNLWNGFVTLINAWMPEYVPDPNDPPALLPLVFYAIIAILGILFTSVLIGLVTSMIEDKIVSLRRGDSPVHAEDHVIILGFNPGEYTLLRQLILAADEDPCTIVIASETEKDEMEQLIADNVEVPKNITLLCRCIDIYDPSALTRLSPRQARSILISPTHNEEAAKMILALTTLIDENDPASVNAILYKNEFRFPAAFAKAHNVHTLQTNDTIAKVIARASTQPGISQVMREVFNFEGCEFYLAKITEAAGMPFRDLMMRMDQAVPLGFFRDGFCSLNPDADTILQPDDRIIMFAHDRRKYHLRPVDDPLFQNIAILKDVSRYVRSLTKVAIIGHNHFIKTVIRELPTHVREVALINSEFTESELEKLRRKYPSVTIEAITSSLSDKELRAIGTEYHHIILLSSHKKDVDKDDMHNAFLLLHLRDIRERYDLSFNVTAEMIRESNQSLVAMNDQTDFVVASNMASLFLGQMSENPDLIPLFSELLSNQGEEILLAKAKHLRLAGTYSIAQLRMTALSYDYTFIGYVDNYSDYIFNPPLEETITLDGDDYLILIGEATVLEEG